MATELATTHEQGFTLMMGGRDSIKELATRLRLMMPNATKFSDSESMAVAQVAVMNGLDPFNGEVWGIKDKDGLWKGVMVGVKGLRKSATRQARIEETVYWTEFIQVDSAKIGATKPGSIAFECHLRDTVKVQAWGKSLNILTTSGVPYAEAVKMLGKIPEVVGVGIADPGEFSRMGITQRAKKRAESDAIKQRFQVSFGAGVIAEGDKVPDDVAQAADESESIITGTVVDATPAEPMIDEKQAAYEAACELAMPSGKKLREYNDSQLEALKNNKQVTDEFRHAAGLIIDYRIEKAKRAAEIIDALY